MQSQAVSNILAECEARSKQLLRNNLTPRGYMAASFDPQAVGRGYHRVFGRDAALCAMAACTTGDPDLIDGARNSLATLARGQADNGQIPKWVDPSSGAADFWYLGCIDATLWWLIALRWVARRTNDRSLEHRHSLSSQRAIAWLRAQEHPHLALLQQNEASDWADIMPRSGFVLYTNSLWYEVKRRYALPGRDVTRAQFNSLFAPDDCAFPDNRRLRLLAHYVRRRVTDRELFLSFVNFASWGEEGDVFGNLLALLFGLADDYRAARILREIDRIQQDAPLPIRVTRDPIQASDPLWRPYMARHRQNLAYRYHNGGIWPFVGGFWVLALIRVGRIADAKHVLTELARANAIGNWRFSEWFHGRTGEPAGMRGQTWNAALFLLASESVRLAEATRR